MLIKTDSRFTREPAGFNMTPIIDVVFLLIIFFMLICQFIVAENFPVDVPDNCTFAQNNSETGPQLTTVTVMKTQADSSVTFAVGSEKITAKNSDLLVDRLAEAIDSQLENMPASEKLVCLRIDKEVCYADSQYALAAIANSSATKIQLAALKEKHLGTK